jgi:hypothetical protein
MSRKTILSLAAAITLAISALTPTSASAFGQSAGARVYHGGMGHVRLSYRPSTHVSLSAHHVRYFRHTPQYARSYSGSGRLCWLTGCPQRPQPPRAPRKYPPGPI